MNGLVKLRLIRPAAAKPAADLEPRCTHALELLLASRGNPSSEVENALAIDPHSSCMGSSRSPPLDVKRPSRRLSLRFAGRWFCGLAGRLGGHPHAAPLRSVEGLRGRRLCGLRRTARARARCLAQLWRESCSVLPCAADLHRGGACAPGGAHGAEAGIPINRLLRKRLLSIAANQRTQLEDAPTNF